MVGTLLTYEDMEKSSKIVIMDKLVTCDIQVQVMQCGSVDLMSMRVLSGM